jgi:hypothetical protein
MKLPPITTKQHEIITLLYRYRFLNRIQIQRLMGHKDHRRINAWLKDLREKHYIEWIYSTDFTERRQPGIYYLGLNGVRLLKTLDTYPIEEVRKRYKESGRSESFISRSVLLAECCIDLSAMSSEKLSYDFQTQADYTKLDSKYGFLARSDAVRPHLWFEKQEVTPEGVVTKNYLLEIFDTALPRYRAKRRLKLYEEYLEYEEWQRKTQDKSSPIILVVCPTVAELIYAKRRTRKLLEYVPGRKHLHIKLTTAEKIQQRGVTGEIWEEA